MWKSKMNKLEQHLAKCSHFVSKKIMELKNLKIIYVQYGTIYAKILNLNYSPTLQKQTNAFKVIVTMNLIAADFRFSL